MFTTLTDIVHYIKISMECIATIPNLYVWTYGELFIDQRFRGGVEQTIVGQHLDSVHEIYARLTMTILHQEQAIYKQADYKDERLEGVSPHHGTSYWTA